MAATAAGAAAQDSESGVESTIIRVEGEAEIVQPDATATVESDEEGHKVVTVDQGDEEHRVKTSETDFTAESAGVDLPPGAKLEKSLGVDEIESSRALLPAMAGSKTAIYSVGDMTVDEILDFYTSHKSGKYSVTIDGRDMNMPAVLIGTSDNPQIQIAIQIPEDGPPALMILDLSKSSLDMSESEGTP